MPSINPIQDPEQERIDSQLVLAELLRKQGMAGDGGARMVGNLFVKGNQWGNLAQVLGGAVTGGIAQNANEALGTKRDAERQAFLSSMPQATETVPQAGPAMDGGSLPDVQWDVPPRQLAQAMQAWAAKAPRGMEGVRNFALQQAMTAPEKQAEAAQRAADRMQELQMKMLENRATQAEKMEWQERQDRLRAQDKRDNIILAKSLSGGSATADLDRQLKELRIKALEGKLDTPKALPVGAQTHQRSLQNLESGLAAYEQLLKSYDPQSRDVGTDAKRAAIKSAFTDLQMGLKGAYELGAITGPDMEILQGAITDPTSMWGMARGAVGGRAPFEAQISQARAGLNRSKRNFEQQYGVSLPEPAGQMQAPMPGATTGGFKVLGVRDK